MLLLVILKWPLIKSKCMYTSYSTQFASAAAATSGKITSITPFIIRRFCVVFLITYFSAYAQYYCYSTQQYRKFILDCASIVVCRTIKRQNKNCITSVKINQFKNLLFVSFHFYEVCAYIFPLPPRKPVSCDTYVSKWKTRAAKRITQLS